MPFTIEYDNEKQVIIGRVSGLISKQLLRQYTLEMEKNLQQDKPKLILSDYRAAKLPLSMVDVYNLPLEHTKFLQSLGSNIFDYKRALLFDKKNLDLANFFENVAVNRGQKVKVFLEESDAFEWLLSS